MTEHKIFDRTKINLVYRAFRQGKDLQLGSHYDLIRFPNRISRIGVKPSRVELCLRSAYLFCPVKLQPLLPLEYTFGHLKLCIKAILQPQIMKSLVILGDFYIANKSKNLVFEV